MESPYENLSDFLSFRGATTVSALHPRLFIFAEDIRDVKTCRIFKPAIVSLYRKRYSRIRRKSSIVRQSVRPMNALRGQ